jgi:hypothetical protein|uniref:hypothetical protein n=1 Tax=Polynucleobacter sp. TaxID=2029855 RepID=UPI0040475AF4
MLNDTSRARSKIRDQDKKAIRLLCTSLNDLLLSGKNYKTALVKMMESQKYFIPELRSLDSENILAGYNAQMILLLPRDIRKIIIQLITHLITKHINPQLDAADCFLIEILVDKQLLQLKDWEK